RGELAADEGNLGEHIVVYSKGGRILRAFGPPSPAAGTCGLSGSPGGRRLLVQVEENAVLRNRLPRSRRPQRGAFTGFWTVSAAGRHWRLLPFRPAAGPSCTLSWR